MLKFCASYGNTASSSVASGSATASTTAAPTSVGGASATSATTFVAVTGSGSAATTVTFNSGAGVNKVYGLTGGLLGLGLTSLFW